MKKVNLQKKLQLRRETLRPLTAAELQGVVGGMPPISNTCQSGADDGNQCGTKRA